MNKQDFVEHKFEFAPTQGVVFDTEVAKEIAAAVQENDGGRYNHSHGSQFGLAVVEVDGISKPFELDEEEYGEQYTERIVLPGKTLSDLYNPNTIFAREYQRALDRREYSNRMSIKGSIGMVAIVSTIPAAFSAALFSPGGLTQEEALASAGIGVSLGAGLGGYDAGRNIYRRMITNPDSFLSAAHAERAADLAKSLDLGPVISKL